ncbi:cohesin complex subunit psm1 [Phaffia rhodozyma]|uniref:Structural maintenance of chromosomes protein n=1 Tax=Phaffia rhodozyma TaxID=264483 RepID=A0A0F7SGA4_PHARH|nr:cohesin complex subunit psm1 [Phaffia rhodozyma]
MLTRLETFNFKSYRGHQTIGPFLPFSCIIGPNGSGKSNLMDAISFVLGIKSSQLRSKQLKDLIYRGRKLARGGSTISGADTIEEEEEEESEDEDEGLSEEEGGKKQKGDRGEGSGKKAWVKAFYQDETDREWVFQRTVSLSGSSEYKLDGTVITYSQYNQALADHNILVKAKNFLVFQGDVEAVARQSPADLCRLIEQISGSLELAPAYEKAKLALDKATALSTENFHNKREIAKEFKAYKEHKVEATKLTKLRQQKEEVMIQHILWRLYHIQQGIDDASGNIVAKNQELDRLRANQSTKEKEILDARREQTRLKNQIGDEERNIKRREKNIDQENSRLVTLETQITHAERKAQNAESLGVKVEKDAQRQTESLGSLRRDLAQVERLAQEAADEQQRLAERQGQALSEADLNEYRQLKAQANALLPQEHQRLSVLQRQQKTRKEGLASDEEKLNILKRRRLKLEAEIDDLKEKKDTAEEKEAQSEQDRTNAQEALERLQSERTRIRHVSQLETETNEKLTNCYMKIMRSSADKKASEKEIRLKESIATLKRIFPGVHGRVVDLCKPTATKYNTAVGVVLGRNNDSVVVDHEKTAIECINYLRTQRLGQATFLPLDSIQVKPTNDKYRNFTRGARLAIDVIDFNPQFEKAMQHACGNSLICDTLETARYVCYEKNQDVKAVSLDGTVIHKSGSITGGHSQHEKRSFDENELTALHQQRDSLMAHLAQLAKERPKAKSDEHLVAEITRLESELAIVRDDLSAINLRLTGLQDELRHAETESSELSTSLDEKRSSLSVIEVEILGLLQTVNASEDEVFDEFCARIEVADIREYEEVQLRVAQAQSEARVKYEAQINRLRRQSEFEAEQLELTQTRLRSLTRSAATERASLTQFEADRDELTRSIDEHKQEIQDLLTGLKTLQDQLDDRTQKFDDIKRTASKATKTLDKAIKEIGTWNDVIERLGSERASIYRRAKFEDIDLPLESGSLNNVPIEAADEEDVPDAMHVDGDEDETQRPLQVKDYGIQVDFDGLTDEDKENGADDYGEELENEVARLDVEILRVAPNAKAAEKMGGVQARLNETEKQVDRSRKESSAAREQFNAIRKQRTNLFQKAYTHISERIDSVYKDLTKGNAAPMGGVAYLSLEDSEEPYLAGIKYHAMPPMKRFRDMDQLSGGEQTVAALALLFAIHSFQPAPFFVLDEVDAALDNTNVTRLARYLREHSSESFQFIVISLKDALYEKSNSLVGIYRDQEINSSQSLTLDLRSYEE